MRVPNGHVAGSDTPDIATSAKPVMRTPEALDVFGSACFGLKEEYVPVGMYLKRCRRTGDEENT